MKTAISVCNTPMQIINTINLMVNHYPNCIFDLVITNAITNYKILYQYAIDSKVFRNVYTVKVGSCRFIPNGIWTVPFHFKKLAQKISKSFNSELTFNYDYFFCYNIENRFINDFCFAQKKIEKIVMFDEGVGAYFYASKYLGKSVKNRIKNSIRYLLNTNYVCRKINIQYLYTPELALYQVPFMREKLAPLTKNQEKITTYCNKIFNYKPDDLFDRKFIFFEQPFESDGYNLESLKVIESIADCVGIENLTIKIHPRSNPEKYKKYHVNSVCYIPWELYLLNAKKYNNYLISVSSSSLCSPFMLFGIDKPVFFIINLLDSSRFSQLFDFMFSIFEKYPRVFVNLNNVKELNYIINRGIEN